jgi:hypothetical protein
MAEDKTFFGRLKSNFTDLVDLIQKNDYVILEPKRKLIDNSNLTRYFYCNHIYYKSPYDDSLYINLNGKVLKYEHPKFRTYLGWKKEMILTIKESTKVLNGNQCFQLDNVCDEPNYTETKTSVAKNQLQKKKSMEDYLDYNKSLLKSNQIYSDSFERFKKFTKEMKNNYMFMKGYEESYSKIFNDRKEKLVKKFTEYLGSTVEDYNTNYNITSELVDSLVFNEMYKFIFKECLVKFYGEEEKKIRKYLKENPSKYDWDGMKIDEVYYKCKFETAIQFLDNINSKKTVFEKKEVLSDVNNLIIEEAKNIFESQKKKNFILDGNDIISFWIYVIAHCQTKNILAEAKFISLFGSNGFNSDDYIAINFATAAQTIKDEILKNENTLSQYVEPNKINL